MTTRIRLGLRLMLPALGPFIAVVAWSTSACGEAPDEQVNTNGGDASVPVCGNGQVEGTEQCDDGASNSDTLPDACRTTCELARCGDGTVDSDEDCDDGPQNSDVAPDLCRTTCRLPRCGDGVVDVGAGELCDCGEDPLDLPSRCDDPNGADGGLCSDLCAPRFCGNGVLDPEEECDDGGFQTGDGCGPTCMFERCGNGFFDPGESCDDGSLASRDGCSSQCQTEVGRFGWSAINPMALPLQSVSGSPEGELTLLESASPESEQQEPIAVWRLTDGWRPVATGAGPVGQVLWSAWDPVRMITVARVLVSDWISADIETWELSGSTWTLADVWPDPDPWPVDGSPSTIRRTSNCSSSAWTGRAPRPWYGATREDPGACSSRAEWPRRSSFPPWDGTTP